MFSHNDYCMIEIDLGDQGDSHNNKANGHFDKLNPNFTAANMGQTLSEPLTAKETSCCANDVLRVGASCMQGWRINMEDAHTHILSLSDDKDTAFFAVYDGHGGDKIAQYAGANLHKNVLAQPCYKDGDIVKAIKQGFLETDAAMMRGDPGNIGDSRAIASVKGQVQNLSYDHKPNNELENKRIVAAGGWVDFNRVNGNLALSRALGDFVFKKNTSKSSEEQIVIAYPDVIVKDITADHEFLVLACDGIWDVLTNEEVVDFIRVRIAQKMEPEDICEELMTRCLAPDCQMGGLGCDNMTVILVCFLHNESYDRLVEKCSITYSDVVHLDSSQDSDSDSSFDIK
ncbi:putative protein phosphatase 2C T23F11.1 [Nymphon striatum]|nr:putative protein phosphatase 2C T23F11.1 [Nymphon striatum]